jgi:hypothetical protein
MLKIIIIIKEGGEKRLKRGSEGEETGSDVGTVMNGQRGKRNQVERCDRRSRYSCSAPV